MNDYITWLLLALIAFGNSRYGVRVMNWIDNNANRIRKSMKRMVKRGSKN